MPSPKSIRTRRRPSLLPLGSQISSPVLGVNGHSAKSADVTRAGLAVGAGSSGGSVADPPPHPVSANASEIIAPARSIFRPVSAPSRTTEDAEPTIERPGMTLTLQPQAVGVWRGP